MIVNKGYTGQLDNPGHAATIPDGVVPDVGSTIEWDPDGSLQAGGWKICIAGMPPPPPPSPPPSPPRQPPPPPSPSPPPPQPSPPLPSPPPRRRRRDRRQSRRHRRCRRRYRRRRSAARAGGVGISSSQTSASGLGHTPDPGVAPQPSARDPAAVYPFQPQGACSTCRQFCRVPRYTGSRTAPARWCRPSRRRRRRRRRYHHQTTGAAVTARRQRRRRLPPPPAPPPSPPPRHSLGNPDPMSCTLNNGGEVEIGTKYRPRPR